VLGIFGMIIGFSGITYGSLMIHAVVRRLLAAARQDLTPRR
jgi:hypothetical protein